MFLFFQSELRSVAELSPKSLQKQKLFIQATKKKNREAERGKERERDL